MSYQGPGIYRHFKGMMYLALCTGQHTETGERLVAYVPLYGLPERDGATEPCFRPLKMWDENVPDPSDDSWMCPHCRNANSRSSWPSYCGHCAHAPATPQRMVPRFSLQSPLVVARA